MPVKGWIEVNELFCKGCGLCVDECPQEVLALDLEHLTPKGYHPVHIIAEGCTGCGICAVICPEAALTVYREAPVRVAKRAATQEV
ncbi:MAG: ferredoxin family protein [Anaerolineales bacterium]|nr:ferredoxin family protein [Anaerolineales bacterium]